MTRHFLKSTTAIVLSLSLCLPMPVLAQASGDAAGAEQSQANAPDSAQDKEKKKNKNKDRKKNRKSEEQDEGDQQASDSAAEVTEQPQVAPDAGDAPKVEAAPEAQAGTEAAPKVEATPQTQAEAGAAPEVKAAPEAQVETQVAPEAGAVADKPADAAAVVGSGENKNKAADGAKNDKAGKAKRKEENSKAAQETTGESAPADGTAQTAPVDAAAGADTSADSSAQADGQAADSTAQDEVTPTQADRKDKKAKNDKKDKKAENKKNREAKADEDPGLTEVDPEQQAARAEELARESGDVAALEDGAAEGEAEVTTETVTEENTRAPDEEFDTPATESAPAAPAAQDDDGLSKAQKIALFGLGALAVGALLKNGDRVVSNSGDRVVVQGQDGLRVLKNDDALLRQPGSEVRTETFKDGSTRTTITGADGVKVVTVATSDGRVLRRTRILPDGREYVLFDDTRRVEPVNIGELTQAAAPTTLRYDSRASEDDLRRALQATRANAPDRSFSLSQIRNIDAVRHLAPEIEVADITFETGSSVIRPEMARDLAALGGAMRDAIAENPGEVFLIEGHTDAVGGAGYNLALSDRRAETVALALNRYFEVPAANLVVQGYGETDLKVRTGGAERANRRVAVRPITALLN